MEVIVRQAEPEDAQAIWELIHELAIFERAEEEHTCTVAQLMQDLSDGHFHAFVAENEQGMVPGMALFYPIYSTWKGLSFYLEDIIVKEAYRRQGIGKKLFDAVMHFAGQKGAGRLGWQVLDWNEPAIQFYKGYEAELDNDWITCRIRKEKLQAFAESYTK
jgi:ribosomal protein S18 acetylase RimI-like enzyme